MATTSSRPNSPADAYPAAPLEGSGGAGKAPPTLTGFVLKLYNMVNGASDDIVSWMPSGEAFCITDLSRLESETLPQFFRHSRFQSLVRQLNFYNFRKINRERTFWVYYHPLFHRDRPGEMHRLRRRTCPGFDGRRNQNRPGGIPTHRGPSPPPPPPSALAGISWSSEGRGWRYAGEGKEEEHISGNNPDGMASSPAAAAGMKVSRSPSPSNLPSNGHPYPMPTGGSGRPPEAFEEHPSLESVVSEEERSPSAAKGRSRHLSAFTPFSSDSHGFVDSQPGFQRTVSGLSEDLKAHGFDLEPPADPLQAEEYAVVHQLNSHLSTSGKGGYTKKSRKAKIWSDENQEDAHSNSQARKQKREDLQERQDHLLAVAEVSRRLDGVCSDYAASIAAARPRGQRKGRTRMGGNGDADGQAIRQSSASPVAFGLDKPYNHYFGAGKCDMLTYDCDDGFVIDDRVDSSAVTPVKKPKPQRQDLAVPPSVCPVVNQSLVQACMEGTLVDASASLYDRTLASAILSFSLSTHPRDPDLASKIEAHLKRGPMLAREFDSYREALEPCSRGRTAIENHEDLKRHWKIFAMNFMRRNGGVQACREQADQLSVAENEAIERCIALWFREI